jgi:hypothetical protein
MNKRKTSIVIVALVLVLVAVALVIFSKPTQYSPNQIPSQVHQNITANNPTSTDTINAGVILSNPVVTIYKAGFVKIEIPLNNQTSRSSFAKTVFAADNSVYTVYRSIDSNPNFVQVAVIQNNGNLDKYIAVYDTSYPPNATNLSYKYSLSRGGQTSYSSITSTTLQQAVDEGLQPWRLDPLWVAEADHSLVSTISFREPCGGYGLSNSGVDKSNGTGKLVSETGTVTYCDVYSIVSQNASAGVAQAKVIHDGRTYFIDLIKPIPGDGKIWMIQSITESNG